MGRIDSMTSKVNLFRDEQRLQKGDTMTRTEDSLLPPGAPSEIKGLLSTKEVIKDRHPIQDQTPVPEADAVNVTIENGIYSLNDPNFENRDKSLNLDLE